MSARYSGGVRNARIVSINPGTSRLNSHGLPIEVRVKDGPMLSKTYEALEWLITRGYRDDVDWEVIMFGATRGYSSFYFKDQLLSTEFTMVFG